MEKVKTGINGLDNMLAGGIPAGSSVLVTGSCGTGKSIISLQYLVNGAKSGDNGLYVSFEESKEKIIEHGKQFGWDISGLEKSGKLVIYSVETDDMGEILESIKKKVIELKIKRVVLDSLTTMMEHGVIYRSQVSKEMGKMFSNASGMNFPSDASEVTRKDVYFIVGQINKLGTTSILISEVAEKSNYLSRDTVSEFAVDGVIMLEVNAVGGSPERLLSVKKMRGTPVDLKMSIMEFTKDGIEVRN